MLTLIRSGFGISPSLAAKAAVAAIVTTAVAGVSLIGGDQRSGLFPTLMAVAAACLMLCTFGVLARHQPGPQRSMVVGGLWVAACFAAVSVAFAAIGVGDLLGIEEDSAGILAWIPVSAMGLAVLTFPAAQAVLAFGVQRSRVRPRWGSVAVWTLVPLVPLTLILAGVVDGAAENWVPAVMLSIIVMLWGVVGQSLRIATKSPGGS
ncbi:MAG TPA: hypothetical protein VLD62_11040 [Acidimicrobiia bacterium]|nr:hypothetical protein [Acidimicrobiia bacterium]